MMLLFASTVWAKEDSRELLGKSFQQGDLWTQGPVKLVAEVRLPQPSGDINVTYTVSWAGPDKWRAEWSAEGLQDVTVLNGGKLSHLTNQKAPIVWAMLFESALATLDGADPAGPYTSAPPIDWEKAKLDTSKKKVGSVDARCVAFGQPADTLCIDPATAHLLTADADFTTFEYADYVAVGNNAYPQSVKVSFNKQLLSQGKVTVTRGEKFADNLFTPPDKSTTVDDSRCADVDKNFTAPRLSKKVEAKMPDAARKAKKYGVVWVVADVGKDGTVVKATTVGGDPDLNPAATEAVQQYKFSPYMRCGQAVAFEKLVMVPFAPPQRPADTPVDVGTGKP
jgi:hypothetical protein